MMENKNNDIKCVYYGIFTCIYNDTETGAIDYVDDREYLMNNVHKRDNKIWVDKINDKLYHITFCSSEYFQYKLAKERDIKISKII
jgi:hypothetical protein